MPVILIIISSHNRIIRFLLHMQVFGTMSINISRGKTGFFRLQNAEMKSAHRFPEKKYIWTEQVKDDMIYIGYIE